MLQFAMLRRISYKEERAWSIQLSQHSKAFNTLLSDKRITISLATRFSRSSGFNENDRKGRFIETEPTREFSLRRAAVSCALKSNLNGGSWFRILVSFYVLRHLTVTLLQYEVQS